LACPIGVHGFWRRPAVAAETGGRKGGGAVLTPIGERVIALYRAIETNARTAANQEFRSIGKLVRPEKTPA